MNKSIYIFSTVLAGILWGSISIFIKGLSAAGFSTVQILFLKALFVIVFQLILITAIKPSDLKIRFRDLWIFCGSGILSITFFQLCYFHSILTAGASTSVILLYTSPVWVLLFSAFLFREKITVLKTLAIIFTLAGCIMITNPGTTSLSAKGITIGLCAGMGYGLYSIFARYALNRYSAKTLVFWTFLLNGLVLLPVNLVPSGKALSLFQLFTPSSVLLLAGLSIFCTAIPYILYSFGLSGLENSQAAIFVTVEPLAGSLTGFFLWQESFSLLKVAGIAVMLTAIVLAGLSPEKKA